VNIIFKLSPGHDNESKFSFFATEVTLDELDNITGDVLPYLSAKTIPTS